MKAFFDRVWAQIRYSGKAAVAALSPIAVELIDNLGAEFTSQAQLWITLAVGTVAVWFTPNAPKPLSTP